MLKIIAGIATLTCCTGGLHAQIVTGKNEIGINAGVFIYQGDLEPSAAGSWKTPKLQLGIYYNRLLTNYFSVRANFYAGSLKGDESKYDYKAYRQRRNFKFSSPVKEFSVVGVLIPYGDNFQRNITRLSPYFFAGIGYNFLNIHRDWSKLQASSFHPDSPVLTGLGIDSTTQVPKGIPVIPIGIGARYTVSQRISLTAEANYRYTFTDYLDGFSYAANPSHNDSYYSLSVGAVYNFGSNQMKCPVIKN